MAPDYFLHYCGSKSLITSLLSGISSCSGPLTYISCPRPGISHFSSNYNRPLAIGLCEFHSRFNHTFRNICWLCGRFSGLADDLAFRYWPLHPPGRFKNKGPAVFVGPSHPTHLLGSWEQFCRKGCPWCFWFCYLICSAFHVQKLSYHYLLRFTGLLLWKFIPTSTFLDQVLWYLFINLIQGPI